MPPRDAPTPSPVVNGNAFMQAFWTVLVKEYMAKNIGIAYWAELAQVDRRSLGRFVQSKHARAVSCDYAWRLCEALELPFHTVVKAAVDLATRPNAQGRYSWKASLPRREFDVMRRFLRDGLLDEEANLFCRRLCDLLAVKIARSKLSKSELARRGGVERATLSRLGNESRQNLTLPVLFNIAAALGEPLDELVESAAKACFQKKSPWNWDDVDFAFVRERIVEIALHRGLSQAVAQDVAFHMTDWVGDLHSYVEFCADPGRMSNADAGQMLVSFLIHVPNHIAAAGKLFADFPVTDIFEVGATTRDRYRLASPDGRRLPAEEK